MKMTEEDIAFIKDMVVSCNDVEKRKEWRIKEENLQGLIDLHDKYGGDVVWDKIQELKGNV
jgi:hypothetical protein